MLLWDRWGLTVGNISAPTPSIKPARSSFRSLQPSVVSSDPVEHVEILLIFRCLWSESSTCLAEVEPWAAAFTALNGQLIVPDHRLPLREKRTGKKRKTKADVVVISTRQDRPGSTADYTQNPRLRQCHARPLRETGWQQQRNLNAPPPHGLSEL